MRAGKAAITAAALVLAGGASTCTASADPPPPAPAPAPGPATPPGPAPAPATRIDHDGTYKVGTDIVPGTYSSAGPVTGARCYWKRLGGDPGNDVIDSALSAKPQVVQIDQTDKAFKTDGCQPWQKTDAADGAAPAEMPPPNAQAQLRAYLDTLNNGARQFGTGPLPGP